MTIPPPVDVRAQVAAVEPLNYNVVRVRLQLDRDVARLAGQYLEIRDGDAAYAFSIASPPESGRDLELHVRYGDDNPSSLEVMSLLRGAGTVQLRLPLGNCVLVDEPAQPLLLIAGATGFSQVQAFVEHAIACRWAVPITLCWGARTAADFYLAGVPARWQREHANIRCRLVVSQGVPAAGMQAGLVHEVALAETPDLSRALVYACGSPPMVYAALDAFTAAGLPRAQFFSDVLAWAPR